MNLALSSSQVPPHWQLKNPAHALACQTIERILPGYLAALDGERSGRSEQILANRFRNAVAYLTAAHKEPASDVSVDPRWARKLLLLSDHAWVLCKQLDALREARGAPAQELWTMRMIATKVLLQELLEGRGV